MRSLAVEPLGVVLAGGASSRMGLDKATLVVDGLSFAERAARRLGMVCRCVVVADGGRGIVAGLDSVDDSAATGPAAGILGAAAAQPGRALLVLACDLPMVPTELLGELCRYPDADWVVPKWERGLEPLAALYRPTALDLLRVRASNGRPAPSGLVFEAGLSTRFLEAGTLAGYGSPAQIFLNLNQPDDVRRFETLRGDQPPCTPTSPRVRIRGFT